MRENTENYLIFPVQIKKKVEIIGKNGEEFTKIISSKLKLIYCTKFIVSLLLNLFNNLAKWIYKIKCKYAHENKKCETCGIKHKECECCLEYINIKEDLIVYKCLHCK